MAFLGMELEMRGNLGGEKSERGKWRGMGLGFKEVEEEEQRDTETAVKAAFLNTDFMLYYDILVGSFPSRNKL